MSIALQKTYKQSIQACGFSVLPTITDRQTKCTMRYHFILIGQGVKNKTKQKQKIASVSEEGGMKPLRTAGGGVKW